MPGRVGVVTGGGSGHKPAFLGYIGPGLLDAVAIGKVFASPTAKSFHAAFQTADSGAGVASLFGDYAGNNMNVKVAVKLAAKDGVTVQMVVADDDVASAEPYERDKRHGVSGEIARWKAGDARAAEGANVSEVIAAAQKAIDQTRSVGIGLSACTIPAAGKPNLSIQDGHMEVGIGHHREPGIAVMPISFAKDIGADMVERIAADLPLGSGDNVSVFVSGLGATPVMEFDLLDSHVDEMPRA